MFTKAV